ncbi:hypothetical protein RIF29_04298 [Crotalaria pallida]|uniref:C2 domain-containing protein n=1 Tax=Crotalaria pallida TaxID=3830 RepID=A0AAN9J3C0_CROPI
MRNNDSLTLRNNDNNTITGDKQKKKRFSTDDDDDCQILTEQRARTMQNMKLKSVITDNTRYILHVKIIKALGIDSPMLHPLVRHRFYKVALWVEPNKEYYTSVVQGCTPQWLDILHIDLKNPCDHPFLYVEVLRFGSKVDPGTSTGMVVVGRARISYPKEPGCEVTGKLVDLLRPDQGGKAKPEGVIRLSMKLERFGSFS